MSAPADVSAPAAACPHAHLLCVHDLRVEYPTSDGRLVAVDGVSFSIDSHELVGLVGPSGSGKSTAALALMNLVKPPGAITGGSVVFRDLDLLQQDERRLRAVRGSEISLIVQSPRRALNPMLPVGRQITNVIRAHTEVSAAAAHARAVGMLQLVGINDPERRIRAYPHELSGGMAQRVLIAMALSCTPALLIADDPTSGLDVTIQAQILDDLLRSVQTTGSSALIVTQDLGIIANYCDRVLVMEGGRLVDAVSVTEYFAGRQGAKA